MSNLNFDPTLSPMLTTLTTPDGANTAAVRRRSPIRSIGAYAEVSDRMAARREGRR